MLPREKEPVLSLPSAFLICPGNPMSQEGTELVARSRADYFFLPHERFHEILSSYYDVILLFYYLQIG